MKDNDNISALRCEALSNCRGTRFQRAQPGDSEHVENVLHEKYRRLFGLVCLLFGFVSTVCIGTVCVADLAPSTAKSVRDILEVGFEPSRESLLRAKSLFESVVKSGDKSPEIAYAYGLVLLKQFKQKEAVEQFRIAAEHPETPCWPAWQALVFTHFVTKETTPGYDRLSDFLKRLQQADLEVPLDEQKRQVQWLGQFVGALGKLAESPKAQEVAKKNDLRLRELLAEHLRPSYDAGWLETDDTALLVETEIHQAKLQQQVENEQERAEKKQKLNTDSEAAKKKAEAVQKVAVDAKRLLDDQLKQYDRLLARLEKEHGLLESRALENIETQNQLDREINASRQRLNQAAASKAGNLIAPRGRLTPEQLIDQMIGQKIVLQQENDRLTQEAIAVTQNGARVVNERQAMIQQYQQKTGLLVKEGAAVQKWQDRLKKDGAKLKAPASDKGSTVSRTLTKAKTLRTYIDFNLEDERQRLLDQLDPPKTVPGQVEKAKDN